MRVVIAEDETMFRETIKATCEANPQIKVVGETKSGRAAIDLILQEQPDAAIIDIGLNDLDGFKVIYRVKKDQPNLKVLIVSGKTTNFTIHRANESGAQGFIDKHSNSLEVIPEALLTLAKGENYFSPAFQASRKAMQSDPNSFVKILTPWQRAVLCLIGGGLSDEEIAAKMDIGARTAKNHRARILQQLGVKNTPKLIAYAMEHGFTPVDPLDGKIPIYT